MRAAVVALVLAAAGVVHATPTAEHPLEDAAGVVPDADEPQLEAELRELRASGVDLGVMVIATTGTESIEAFARARRSEWATGTTPAALFVLAIEDRKSRLEVSDPLRARFPDARARAILDNLKGYLRAADYTGAIRAVIVEVRNGAAGIAPDLESPHPQAADPTARPTPAVPSTTEATPPPPPPPPQPSAPEEGTDASPYIAVAGLVALLVLVAWMWARSRLASRATLAAAGAQPDRGVLLETLWCICLIIGGLFYVALLILTVVGAAAGSSSSSSSSRSSGSSSRSSGSSSRSGGGWSGGGASSGW